MTQATRARASRIRPTDALCSCGMAGRNRDVRGTTAAPGLSTRPSARPLSWNEIRSNAIAFAREWATESSENAEAKSFWDDFFRVFGVPRRRVAVYEKQVEKAENKAGFIDLFWPKILIAEHKSRGKDLQRAFAQAIDYFPGLNPADYPRYVVVSDFARIRLTDLETDDEFEFPLEDLPKQVNRFGFIAGYQVREFKEQDPVNIEAAEKLADLHDALEAVGYTGHELEVYLVRLLFCLFADDTGIFMPRGAFEDFIRSRTSDDGSDLAGRMSELFQVLNRPPEARLKNLDEQLAAFPYVNGKLFQELLPTAAFDHAMRDKLLDCADLDWGQISPAIFGSLFQGIMNRELRRSLGAHYTSEKNILKVIGPLFMDDLKAEFERIKSQPARLKAFHEKLGTLQFFDPACGCGNFLVISYREIRLLELEVIKKLHGKEIQQLGLDVVDQYVKVDVDQFHGIEIEEWPAQIARVALWLIDHQMNLLVGQVFGDALVRIPLVKAANIVHGNALRLDWSTVLPPSNCSYVLGNPPFIGAKFQNRDQRVDVEAIFRGTKNAGLLDYVSCWYRKAADYITGTKIVAAFVSTNSITQGEQVGVLWPDLFARGIKICFAHRTFQWSSEARGKAVVHCVIIGFGLAEPAVRTIFDYDDVGGEPHATQARNINPYLVDAPDVVLTNRSVPLCPVPEIGIGNKPIDGGWYLFTTAERDEFIAREPASARWFRRWLGADEFINGLDRWFLWLGECPPAELRKMPEAMKRVEAVRDFRLGCGPNKKGKTVKDGKERPESTRKLADTPTQFHVRNIPGGPYLLIPRHSSEFRQYLPIGFIDPAVLTGDACLISQSASLYDFGVLESLMHNAWLRAVCGRIKSDYRYSAGIVYNNFPWPGPTDTQQAAIGVAAQGVLDARAAQAGATLADLYDPLSMPAPLRQATTRWTAPWTPLTDARSSRRRPSVWHSCSSGTRSWQRRSHQPREPKANAA